MLDTHVTHLGECRFESPLRIPSFIQEGARVLLDADPELVRPALASAAGADSFENAGPRRRIFFNPAETRVAIVTCGGLCPGLNNVIQGIVRTMHYQYGVRSIFGLRYGYEGLNEKHGHGLMPLSPETVHDIHQQGGTILGSSRGPQDVGRMVDFLSQNRLSILFTVGGDGTLRGAQAISEEITRRGLPIAVVGVPKTIDNDISYVYRSFGFTTAVALATQAIHGGHAEANGARNGIGLVKVMGRESGFIAAYATLASNEVNYAFIPEAKARLHGAGGFLEHLRTRLADRSHALILVAEGALPDLMGGPGVTDASGNIKHGDVGLFLKGEIETYLGEQGVPFSLKYIDPSYIIRSVPPSPEDAVFCLMLAQNAVHGAMAGKTGMLVGLWNSYFTYVPLALAVSKRKQVDAYLWAMVREATGQPDFA